MDNKTMIGLLDKNIGSSLLHDAGGGLM